MTKLIYIAVNDLDAKKSGCYKQVLVVTELVVSGTQCIFAVVLYNWTQQMNYYKEERGIYLQLFWNGEKDIIW